MRYIPPDEQDIVSRAQALGLERAFPPPAYLCPQWCMALSLGLALPSLGYSLIVVPLLWVIQHDRTAARLTRLRLELEQHAAMGNGCQNSVSAAHEASPPASEAAHFHRWGHTEKDSADPLETLPQRR